MASPDVASELVRAYQLDQRRVSRGLLAELLRLWRAVVRLDDLASFIRFAELAAVLVGRRRDESAAIATRFYELFRQSQVPAAAVAVGPFVPVAAAPLAEDAVTGELRGAVLAGFVGGRRAGFAPGKAADNALVRAAGTATRLALNGGRDTILQAVRDDSEALGWLRVTDGDPCHFCLTLASRGPEYKSRATASFQAHSLCGCVAMPVFEGTPMPASTRRAEEIYVAAQRWASEHPASAATGTKNDALNNVRRYLEHRREVSSARDTAA
ncbi:MAG: hypothetical protein IRZ07_06000 [Microbispora sp.]|nr:hypothetical protein [Microbispora sp.]